MIDPGGGGGGNLDPRGGHLDPRGMVGRIYVRDH